MLLMLNVVLTKVLLSDHYAEANEIKIGETFQLTLEMIYGCLLLSNLNMVLKVI